MDNEKPKSSIKPWVLKNLQNKKTGESALSQINSENNDSKTQSISTGMGKNANEIVSKQREQVYNDIADNFRVNPDDYEIFSRQAGVKEDKITKKMESKTLCIDETMSLMVGRTAETITVLTGEVEGIPAADEVIYLDKSARPVSWLVNEFWQDFTDRQKPKESFLAIDRQVMFPLVNLELTPNQEIIMPDGSLKVAKGYDFWQAFDKLPEEERKELLARIRCIYIDGGIDDEDPDKIMSTPTILDGKNITVIDEVSRSGSTIDIAVGLIQRAFPEANSVNGHVFWYDLARKSDNEEWQMGNAPAWYPSDPTDWRGRGVRDVNPSFYEKIFANDPTPQNRAKKYGASFLGVQLNFDEEPGRLSQKLKDEIEKMHSDYKAGRILPQYARPAAVIQGSVLKRLMERAKSLGVEFVPAKDAKNRPNAYINVIEKLINNK